MTASDRLKKAVDRARGSSRSAALAPSFSIGSAPVPVLPRPRAAIYLRVSTDEQTVDNQRPALAELAERRGLAVVATYEETASGAKRRPELERLLEQAHRRAFDVLLVWALDRIGRSMVGNLQLVLELDRLGVVVISHQEAWLDTGGPVRPLLISIVSWIAEQERARLVERTRAGMDRARRQGTRIGRPPSVVDVARARVLRESGATLPDVARELGVSLATLRRALRGLVIGNGERAFEGSKL